MTHKNLLACPMCDSKNFEKWCEIDSDGFETVKCNDCSLIFVRNPYDKESLQLFYKNYYSSMHQENQVLNMQREIMYELELTYLSQYKMSGKVLDVGCSGGQFLNHFHARGFECEGVEFGKEAAEEAMKNFKVYIGEFPEITIPHKFDIIVFRGCIEHVDNPRAYLKKAMSLLNEGGIIFISATQNRDSVLCELFKSDWNMHLPKEHLYHFSVKDFVNYFRKFGLKFFAEKNLYLETPYANFESDLNLVLQKLINPATKVKCPPFFDNMMTAVFQF
ncbi:class I SAM-dependent methyltransferase [Asinibacterium sp. OR53]|uniref:class I SAM-dependent methyltransferase n=1 Tax=Asinibacterium sp. OR53 TaxID=925409 RepID=UPI0004B3F49E|nr:class I SAM-dependent methyltransferase [Asinibacterium sp. OR53]